MDVERAGFLEDRNEWFDPVRYFEKPGGTKFITTEYADGHKVMLIPFPLFDDPFHTQNK